MIKRRISALFLHIVKAMPLALVLLFALKPVFADTSFYPAGSTLMCNYDEFGETDSVVFDAVWCQECSEDALRTTTCQLNVDETAGTCSYTGMCKEGYITLENPATANMYCVVNPVNYEIHYNNMFDGWFVDSVSNPSSFNVETPDIILGPAARNGYNFVAWYSDYNSANSHGSTNIVSIIPTGSTGNKELYAGWDIITYELTYDLDGGSLLANNPLTYNVTTPSFQLNNPTKLGYDFAGWCSIVADACVEGEPVVNYSINIGSYGDKDMRAFWSPTEYTITYEYGGGSVSSANRDSYTLETPTFTINNPERTGYTFGGWCEDSETCNNPLMTYTITMGTTGNKHLFAVWTPINYTITYALDGGTETTPNRTSYNIETPTFVLNNPTKSGYTFIGWCEGDSGCQYPNTSYQVTRGNTGNKTLYARWGAQTYHITYTLNGGVANPAGNPTEYSVLTPTFTINNPTRTGFEFDGWCEGGSSCSNPVKNYEIVQGSSGDRNLYARWKSRKFTLIYKCETTATSISNPEYNENFIAVFPDCTKTGYTFDEWTCLRTDNNVNVTEHIYDYVNIGVWDIDSNVVCTGNWEENSYSITYKYVDDNDNDVLINGMSPTSVTFTELSEGVDISGNPTRLGYTFVSWCNDRNRTECQYPLPIQYNGSESTLVSRIIWALWRLTDYTITYNTNGGQNNPNNPDSYNIKYLVSPD